MRPKAARHGVASTMTSLALTAKLVLQAFVEYYQRERIAQNGRRKIR